MGPESCRSALQPTTTRDRRKSMRPPQKPELYVPSRGWSSMPDGCWSVNGAIRAFRSVNKLCGLEGNHRGLQTVKLIYHSSEDSCMKTWHKFLLVLSAVLVVLA